MVEPFILLPEDWQRGGIPDGKPVEFRPGDRPRAAAQRQRERLFRIPSARARPGRPADHPSRRPLVEELSERAKFRARQIVGT